MFFLHGQPGEGARDDGAYEDRVAHRFSIADVEGDEMLLGVVTWIQMMLGADHPRTWMRGDRITPVVLAMKFSHLEVERCLILMGLTITMVINHVSYLG